MVPVESVTAEAIEGWVAGFDGSVRTRNKLLIQLHATGKTRVIRETPPLDQVNEAIADVEAGRVAARIVLEP